MYHSTKPTKSFIPYLGGKFKLAKQIIETMPEHSCYVEVFGGAGNILLRKAPSKSDVINDINKELITLYRVVQNHLEEFVRYFKWVLVSRNEFDRHLESSPETLTDIQRAVRLFYLVKCSFGGKVCDQTFGYSKTSRPRFNLLRIEEDLSDIHLRLAQVNIECLNYSKLIEKYDSESTLFYLDPPYHGVEDYYGNHHY